MAKGARRRRGFRTSVVVTFAAGAAAAGCAQVNQDPEQLHGAGEMTGQPPIVEMTGQPPIVATNPPRPPVYPTFEAGNGAAGVAGAQALAGAEPMPPPAPGRETVCPEQVPMQGTSCRSKLSCDYGTFVNCSGKTVTHALCHNGVWQVGEIGGTCNPPPPSRPDEDAGA